MALQAGSRFFYTHLVSRACLCSGVLGKQIDFDFLSQVRGRCVYPAFLFVGQTVKLPQERGPISAALISALRSTPYEAAVFIAPSDAGDDWISRGGDPLLDEDFQLALFICYELHYQGWDNVSDTWEWEISLLALRARLEQKFENHLRELIGVLPEVEAGGIPAELDRLVAADDGPSLAKYLQTRGDLRQFREFVPHPVGAIA